MKICDKWIQENQKVARFLGSMCLLMESRCQVRENKLYGSSFITDGIILGFSMMGITGTPKRR